MRATPSKATGRRDRACPPKAKKAVHRTRAGNAEGHELPGTTKPAPCTGTTQKARATPTRSGREPRTSREHGRTHTQQTRGADPNRTRGTHRPHGMAYRQAKGRDTRAGRSATRTARDARAGRSPRKEARIRTPRPAASTAHTRPGHCARQGSSSTRCYAPGPQLGSLRASPWRSQWRRASSTSPAALAARATTHQGGSVVGKRLQPPLLSDALTGEWRNGEAGEGQGSEPREPGKLGHQAGDVP